MNTGAEMPEVAVIGAAGYVGRRLCAQLAQDGAAVTGVVRPASGFLLDHAGISWITAEQAAQRRFDVVVNLAYPTSGSVYDYPRRNADIFSTAQRLVASGGMVVQVSTQAVFGMALEYPQKAAPVSTRRDFLYVESKIELENLLIANLGATKLHVVRLGNVWGPGSATWTGAMAQRLLFGEPVAVDDHDGYSNVTDVANVISYLSFLARRGVGEKQVEFHHLAELGGLRWSYWIKHMSEQLEVTPTRAPRPPYPTSGRDEVMGILRAPPRTMAREFKDARFSGSTVRSVMHRLPAQTTRSLRNRWAKGPASAPAATEDQLLTVLCCETPLVPVRNDEWAPPVDGEASWLAVSRWLHEVGYR